ncbi:MAG: dihydroorotase [Candidatus Omnitrophota bacterium]
MKYLIKSGRVIDPKNKIDAVSDIVISGGKIEAVGKGLKINGGEVIDASGRIVAPGFVDMHVHLREPGREDEETILTGTRAALRGGFTAVACMPNTDPAIDSPEAVKELSAAIKRDAMARVVMVGAITLKRAGKELADIGGMKKEGIVAISDDGSSVDDGALMLEALKDAGKNSVLVIVHCEDRKISGKGVVNEGFISTKMGLKGIPRRAEYERVKRDLELAGRASSPLHIAHVSCKESVELIRKAKKEGLKVSAETAPHYFALTDGCCVTYDTNTKMNPPLRTGDDVEAVKRGLGDGTIDVIATDHAPHTDSEKDVEFDFAPFGIIGLETALSISVMELVDKGIISWPGLIEKMSLNPAKLLGLTAGTLEKGSPADVVVIDPAGEYVYARDSIESRSKNSPFIGWRLRSQVTHVFAGGRPAVKDGKI